ncbi:MAG: bifunctional demethylmenaquinone methyltransferase/2-methoxy-6-polyprenyl-1,4-benzoquinol methylase UbiE [Phycisphaerales bacterium]
MPATEPSTASNDTSPAWAGANLDAVHAQSDKARRVRDMFASIAHAYDLNNRLHSLGRDQAWRRVAVRAADVREGDRVLDVACGTGDLTQAFAATSAPEVIGLDFTNEMLDLARAKRDRLDRARASKLSYIQGDAQDLPFDDASFDVVSVAFGIRNVQDPRRALREFARVLRPGGRLVVLEFDRPRNPIVRAFNTFYCSWLMPKTAALISRDRSGAYAYLPKSVGQFMDRDQLRGAILESGFAHATSRPLTLGVCVCHRAVREDAPRA